MVPSRVRRIVTMLATTWLLWAGLAEPAWAQQTCDAPSGWDVDKPPVGPTDFDYASYVRQRVQETGARAPMLLSILDSIESQLQSHPAATELYFSLLANPSYWADRDLAPAPEELGWSGEEPPVVDYDGATHTVTGGRKALDRATTMASGSGGYGYPGRGLTLLGVHATPGNKALTLVASRPDEGNGETVTYEVHASLWVSPLVMGVLPGMPFRASGGCPGPHRGMLGDTFAFVDMDGDGLAEFTEWLPPQDPPELGILVHSLPLPQVPDPDLVLDVSCHEFFGTCNGFENGFRELASLDSNGDGVLTVEELDGVYIWIDRDGDAKIHPWEMFPDMGTTWDELVPLAETFDRFGWDIQEIRLPQDDALESTVTVLEMEEGLDTLPIWDWWPSALEVYPVSRQSGSNW